MKNRKLLYKHAALFCVIGTVAAWGCPFYNILGVTCPLCGTSRAWRSFFAGELALALRYHPLFLVTPAWFLGAVHYDCFFKKKKFVLWLLLMVAAALAVIHVLRLLGILASPI